MVMSQSSDTHSFSDASLSSCDEEAYFPHYFRGDVDAKMATLSFLDREYFAGLDVFPSEDAMTAFIQRAERVDVDLAQYVDEDFLYSLYDRKFNKKGEAPKRRLPRVWKFTITEEDEDEDEDEDGINNQGLQNCYRENENDVLPGDIFYDTGSERGNGMYEFLGEGRFQKLYRTCSGYSLTTPEDVTFCLKSRLPMADVMKFYGDLSGYVVPPGIRKDRPLVYYECWGGSAGCGDEQEAWSVCYD